MREEFSYWISNTEWRKVSRSHAQEVVNDPAAFGLSPEDVRELHETHDESPAEGGQTETEIVKRAAEQGWVRVRKYSNPMSYLSIVADNMEKRAEVIRAFIVDALSTGRIATDDTIVLSSFSPHKTITYAWQDGGAPALIRDVLEAGEKDSAGS